jgi:two-component system chemotaxis response regulator CheB
MPPLRVLVVDDSVAVRRALSEALEREPDLSLCGAAPNGALGLELVERSQPDVVVLDLEMPVLDGLDFLSRLRPQHPRLPVLVFSGTVGQANEATLEALWRGASDYVLKPAGLDAARMDAFLRAELFPRLRAIARAAVPPAPATFERPVAHPAAPGTRVAVVPRPGRAVQQGPSRTESPVPPGRPAPDPQPHVLVVGTSTGGPRALAAALGELPRDFPLPIVVVQHMPAQMAEFFASGLSANCRMRVVLAEDGASVEPGTMWVAPGGAHLTIAAAGPRVSFRLDHGPEQNGCRPAVDPLFRSAARVFGAGTLALVLTGMGHDGLAGAHAVHDAHGRVLVQDEASSVVWGMPGAIARAGLADAVVPLAQMGGELRARARRDQRPDERSGPLAEAA